MQVVRNEPAHIIQVHIEEVFSEGRPDDVLLLHFSGHGLKSESGELFFAASNSRPNRLGSTAVSADFVQRCMRDSRSRSVVLLLDCCYGGAFAQGVTVRAAGDVNVLDSFPEGRSGGRGRAVITASSAMEYAFEGDELGDDQQGRPSVFTSALSKGLPVGTRTKTRTAGSRSTNCMTTSSTRYASRIRTRPRAAGASWRASYTWPAVGGGVSGRCPSRLTCRLRWPTQHVHASRRNH